MEVTRFISSHFFMGIKNGESTYCKARWLLNSFLHSIVNSTSWLCLYGKEICLNGSMCSNTYFSWVRVRTNEATHYVQNLDGLLRNATWLLEWVNVSQWMVVFLEAAIQTPLCIHTVLVCSRWHTGCSSFSIGKHDKLHQCWWWVPLHTVRQQKFNPRFCRLLMTNRFGKFYQN